MAEHNCSACTFRSKYDNHPTSILGRLWRWHTNFCPGWKAYMKSVSAEEKKAIIEKYGFPSDKFV